MARGRLRFGVIVLLFAILRFISSEVSSDNAAILRPRGLGHRLPILLPLFLTSPDSSRILNDSFLRHLQELNRRNPNARMSLYDDLLSNGYYTTRLWIGTPPQEFALIVDTGSTVTYVPCETCEQCGNHQNPRFQPEHSSTYQPLKCNPDCTCDAKEAQCTYERQYAEMSSSSGVLGQDIISFGNQSELTPQRAVFGCENTETGDLYTQHADGIMGLGRGVLSIVDQLVDKEVISDSFSLCYGGMDVGGGAMVLGEISPPSDMVFSYSDPNRSPYYNIELKEIHVAGKPLPLDPKVFDGKHGTVLDSGTTYAYLPAAAFVEFRSAIMNELHGLQRISGPDPNYNDICFSGAGSDASQLSKYFPVVDMVFSNGQRFSLSPENYLFKHTRVRGAYCLGIFQSGKDPTTLLGGIIVRNTLVMYDREHLKIGFWKTNCSELWERLHISGSPAMPSTPIGEDPTTSMAPAMAPSVPSTYASGEVQIGLITFDMSLSMKYSDLKAQITKLSGVIAQELELNISQVHLVSLTPDRNGSLISWAIFPSGSANYFSNSNAMHIISQLVDHHIQLSEPYGNYQIVKWNLQPLVNRTWWQQHYLAVIMGVIAASIIGFSAYGVFFIWRWRRQRMYKPIDAVVAEQELQPIVNE
ncbi:hypothetical protein Nepgr_025906 [Nepenthes gracilis]|uniref:Peptidase A1 domain-containing protein n=1 Tax=Nepenthes gracilis TaxID=150966 RepID=A0AAD3T5W0_NEPGR|nr:hypothetical protein Nepgr_025906 [Nepenthes gracilis]